MLQAEALSLLPGDADCGALRDSAAARASRGAVVRLCVRQLPALCSGDMFPGGKCAPGRPLPLFASKRGQTRFAQTAPVSPRGARLSRRHFLRRQTSVTLTQRRHPPTSKPSRTAPSRSARCGLEAVACVTLWKVWCAGRRKRLRCSPESGGRQVTGSLCGVRDGENACAVRLGLESM